MCIICTSREEEILQLKTLDCSGCVNIKFIPYITSLQRLICYNCPRLETIPHILSLQYLDCHNCNLITIPLLPLLKTLICNDCPLFTTLVCDYVTLFGSLRYFDCSSCPLLKTIPGTLPSLQSLYCSGCPSLTTISVFPALQRLYCSDCFVLAVLPRLPSLRTLSCYNCPLLVNIPQAYFPSLKTLIKKPPGISVPVEDEEDFTLNTGFISTEIVMEEKEGVEEKKDCMICVNKKIATIIIPCGCSKLCITCSRDLVLKYGHKKCPCCNGKINKIMKVFVWPEKRNIVITKNK
jgi:hypothetical protein